MKNTIQSVRYYPKNLLAATLLGTAMLLASCSETTEQQSENATQETLLKVQQRHKHFLLLIDKTLSNSDTLALQAHQSRIRTWLADSLGNNGDRIAAWPINSNTGGDAPFFDEKINVKLPEKDGVGAQTAEDNDAQYRAELKQVQNECLDKIDVAFSAKNLETTNLQTDLWRSLEAASRYFSNCNAGDGQYVLLVSDMVESMKGAGRRDFHLQPIASRQEAETFAQADAAYIRENFKINTKILAVTQFKILFPVQPNSQTQNNMLRYYWEKLFAELGIPVSNIRYDL